MLLQSSDGLVHAIVFDWNGDNAGPYTASQYLDHFKQIQSEFPHARVMASTFDAFVTKLADVKNQVSLSLSLFLTLLFMLVASHDCMQHLGCVSIDSSPW